MGRWMIPLLALSDFDGRKGGRGYLIPLWRVRGFVGMNMPHLIVEKELLMVTGVYGLPQVSKEPHMKHGRCFLIPHDQGPSP